MKKFISIGTLLCLFISCGHDDKTVVIPYDVLTKEKMAHVIADIHIAEAQMNLQTLPDSSSNKKLGFQKIFEKYHITKQQYEKSLSFYIDHPKMLNEIYEQVLNELSRIQSAKKGMSPV